MVGIAHASPTIYELASDTPLFAARSSSWPCSKHREREFGVSVKT